MRRRGKKILVIALAALCGCVQFSQGTGGPSAADESVTVDKTLLLRMMSSGDEKQWKSATDRIEAAGPAAKNFLIMALRWNGGGERAARVREYAARRLGQIKAQDATIELAAALKNPSRFVASEAAAALIAINDPLAVPLIVEMLEATPRPESDAELQMFGVLKSITGQITGFSVRTDPAARAAAIEKCKAWWREHKSGPS